MSSDKTMYSMTSILASAFLGGPLACAYLLKKDLENIGQPEKGKSVFVVGVLLAILEFILQCYYSEKYQDWEYGLYPYTGLLLLYVTSLAIVGVFIFIVYLWTKKNIGKELSQHTLFYPDWIAVKVSFIWLLVLWGVQSIIYPFIYFL